MKKTCILLLVLCAQSTFAALNAYFSHATFDQPGAIPYVETYLLVTGRSVNLSAKENGKYQGTIEVQWIFKQGDSIVYFDKYNLLSPEIDGSDGRVADFIDQQRIPLNNGDYIVELKISDKNSTHAAFSTRQELKIHFPQDRISISDIELLESYSSDANEGMFTKSGYELVPHVSSFYPKQIESLRFYAEIYRSKSFLTEDFIARYSISNSSNNRILNEFAGFKKFSPQEVNVLLAEIPISGLNSGNYLLTIELIDRNNQLLAARQLFFQRSNVSEFPLADQNLSDLKIENTFVASMDDLQELKENVSCLYPISSRMDAQVADNLIKLNDQDKMQRFFYSFWLRKNPDNPEAGWLAYKAEVDKVNQSFSSRNNKGYETDRGRVYLQYGAPNTITSDEMDPAARPYQIWHYYKLNHQTNRKFVFYSMDKSTNDYRLLHSDAQGELQDPAWEAKLYSRTQQFGADLDAEKSIDIFGGKTKENFRNPK